MTRTARWALAVLLLPVTAVLTTAAAAQADGRGGARPGTPRADAGTIAAGETHVCMVRVDDRVTCWGGDAGGQLGNGPGGGAVMRPPTAVRLPGDERARMVAVADFHSCALLQSGSITCWGANGLGQLGLGAPGPSLEFPVAPVALPGGHAAISISAAGDHTCALLTTGQVTCWGANTAGVLGNGASGGFVPAPPTPVALPGGRTATALSTSLSHTCVVLDDGGVTCWGSDGFGQLGNGALAGDIISPPAPVSLPGGRRATAVSASSGHTCALLDDGRVTCWGDDSVGQLGNGGMPGNVTSPPAPVALPGGDTAIAIATSGRDAVARGAGTCALLAGGGVSCWGDQKYGQLGNGVVADVVADVPLPPVLLPGGRSAVALSVGDARAPSGAVTCVVLDTRAVSCWGRNTDGAVGTGVPSPWIPAPFGPLVGDAPIPDLPAAVDTGFAHTCALLAAPGVVCWGDNANGEIGSSPGSPAYTASPSSVLDLAGQSAQAVGTGVDHSCALAAGEVWCWGNNAYGQLGRGGAAGGNQAVPARTAALPAGRPAIDLAVGGYHACAILDDRRVACWGNDGLGQVGDGGSSASAVTSPQLVALPTGRVAAAITAGEYHSCAVLDDGSVSCWGGNGSGQLGIGPAPSSLTTPSAPVAMPGGLQAIRIAAGDGHTCAVLSGSDVSCWGADGSGQLGNGAAGPVNVPTDRLAVQALDVDAGGSHTCVTNAAGYNCWGRNLGGQLGRGTTTTSEPAPTSPSGGSGIAAIAAGGSTTCAQRDGSVLCWGADGYGQLGNGEPRTAVASPVRVSIQSVVFAAAPGGPPATPQPPSGTGAANAATITWPVVSDPAGAPIQYFVVQASPDGGTTWPRAESTAGPETSLGIGGLAAGTYVFRLAAVNVHGTSLWSPASSPVVVTDPPGGPGGPGGGGTDPPPLVTIDPIRLADSRPGAQFVTFDGLADGTTPVAAGTFVEVPVGGRGPIPDDAAGAILNVTATGPAAPGYFTLYDCTAERPLASTVNYAVAQTVPNLAVAKLSAAGTVCIYSKADAHVVVDATGYLPAGSQLTPVTPARLLDTRPGSQQITIDSVDPTGPVAGDATIEVRVAGRGPVPAGASAALLNITVTEPGAPGHVTAWPCDPDRPLASTVNYIAGQTVANAAFVKLSPDGAVCLAAKSATHLVIDVTGWLPAGTELAPVTPVRLLDTRPGPHQITIDATDPAGPVPAETMIEVPIAGRGPVPADAATALVNITATEPLAPGYVTAFSCTPTRPTASNLNYVAGQTVPNAAIVKLSPTGTLCLFTKSTTHLIVDVTGYG